MFSPLELPSRLFVERPAMEAMAALRPVVYGFVPPAEFLCRAVDEIEGGPETLDELGCERPERFFGHPRKLLSAQGMNPEIVEMLRDGFRAAIHSGHVSPREKAQLWYCLRSLGSPPVDGIDSNALLGVVFEFFDGDDHVLVALYADGSGIVATDRLIRWSPREEGEPKILLKNIFAEAALCGHKIPQITDSMPRMPVPEEVGVVLLYPNGMRDLRVKESAIESSPQADLLRWGVEFYRSLVGEADTGYKFDYDSPPEPYAPLGVRAGAAIADLLFFGLFFFTVVFFSRDVISTWSSAALFGLVVSFSFLPPLMGAWMESSPSWGFRTFGKRMFECRVCCTLTGGGLSFTQSLARNFTKWFISPWFLFTGLVWAFFHKYHRTWHDVLSDTVVLKYSDKGDHELDPEVWKTPMKSRD